MLYLHQVILFDYILPLYSNLLHNYEVIVKLDHFFITEILLELLVNKIYLVMKDYNRIIVTVLI